MTTGFYPPLARSPSTELSAGIDNSVTTVPVVNAGNLPAAPNVCTIGGGADSETIKYTGKAGNDLTGCTRGFDPAGSAKAWDSGTPVARVLTAQDLEVLQNAIADFEGVPTGVILLWSGAEGAIPAGWVLCNGANGTPDLRDRFVVGAGTTYAVGNTGGSATHTLTTAEMPTHSHNYSKYATSVAVQSGTGESSLWKQVSSDVYATTETGSDNAHENRPPYYALCYIMKT
jgi:hypothetical protein